MDWIDKIKNCKALQVVLSFRKKFKTKTNLLNIMIGAMVMALCSQTPSCTSSRPNEIDPKNKLAEEPTAIRVPAEWKPQAGIWMQWPTMWEKQLRNDFVRIIDVIQDYEPLNIIVRNRYEEDDTKTFLQDNGLSLTNITWWIYEYDSAWLRDNGPIWVINDQGPMIQDWGFDGWGGFTRWYKLDEKAPQNIADLLNMQCENKNNYILERGNFESNGKDTIILNWDCQNDRNPDWTKEQTEALFKKSFGVSTIIWVYGYEEDDLTKGHIDGVCRFINENTVVVARYADQDDPNAWIYENATTAIENAGFNVLRLDTPGKVEYRGADMPAIYVNWLVGNGFVLMTGFGVPEWDEAARKSVEEYFPGRDVYIVETLAL